MSKAYKPINAKYIKTTGIMHNRTLLSTYLGTLNTNINTNKTNISSLSSTVSSHTTSIQNISDNQYKTGISIPNNNFNNALTDGCYYWTTETSNRPSSNYGTLFVTVSYGITGNNQNNWVNHLAFGTDGRIYFRQKINADPWTSWHTLH